MIRDATHDDVLLLIELGRRLHAESPRFSRLTFSDEKAGNFLRYLIDNPDGWVVVAEKDGRVVGGMAALAYSEWFTHDKIVADVSLFMLPEYRGSFLSARLIRAFDVWAASTGAKYAVAGMSTGIQPEETAALYERLGAERVGPIVEFTWS